MDLKAASRIDLVQPAIIPDEDAFLMKLLQMGGAWLLTFLGIVMGITGWDYMSRRVNVSRDLDKKVGVPVIGSLPASAAGRRWPAAASRPELRIRSTASGQPSPTVEPARNRW